jgi:ATP-dependent RNA helicase SUPV3L1/SUV3
MEAVRIGLKHDQGWFRRTMAELNLRPGENSPADAPKSRSPSRSTSRAYRTLYFANIDRFVARLEQSIEASGEAAPADPAIQSAINRLKETTFLFFHRDASTSLLRARGYNPRRDPESSAPCILQRDETNNRINQLSKSVDGIRAAMNHDDDVTEEQVSLERSAIDSPRQNVEKLELAHNQPSSAARKERTGEVAPLSRVEYQASNAVLSDAVMPIICSLFAAHISQGYAQSLEHLKSLDATTDLTSPASWYPRARLSRRKIIFHAGPTNSGKTYQALERLKQASRGMYLGPLRLLAVEVYEKLTTEGVYCSLRTGQERRDIPFATHTSATMEMASLEEDFDVVVIDEVQMLADRERGFAWTRALIGIRCKEIHLCGGHEALDMVKRIAETCGDDFEVIAYSRFTGLHVSDQSLPAKYGNRPVAYGNVEEGDCIVAFSRNDIFAIKREIEKNTKHKCCVIYGSLPPQTRSEQARRFNDLNSGYNVLVASDAIGMGLNLNIRRIIFNSMYKYDGSGVVKLSHSAVKQISGRAGRRNSPFPVGHVTCRDPDDVDYLRRCMELDIAAIQQAGLLPTASRIEAFYSALLEHNLVATHSSDLHQALQHFTEVARTKGDYFLCRQTDMIVISKLLTRLSLPVRDKYSLCLCPITLNDKKSMDVLLRFASKLASREVPGIDPTMRPRRPKSFDDLSRLCAVYNELEQFLWLQEKFPAANSVMERQAALACKEQTVTLVGEAIAFSDHLKLEHCYLTYDASLRRRWQSLQVSGKEKMI